MLNVQSGDLRLIIMSKSAEWKIRKKKKRKKSSTRAGLSLSSCITGTEAIANGRRKKIKGEKGGEGGGTDGFNLNILSERVGTYRRRKGGRGKRGKKQREGEEKNGVGDFVGLIFDCNERKKQGGREKKRKKRAPGESTSSRAVTSPRGKGGGERGRSMGLGGGRVGLKGSKRREEYGGDEGWVNVVVGRGGRREEKGEWRGLGVGIGRGLGGEW